MTRRLRVLAALVACAGASVVHAHASTDYGREETAPDAVYEASDAVKASIDTPSASVEDVVAVHEAFTQHHATEEEADVQSEERVPIKRLEVADVELETSGDVVRKTIQIKRIVPATSGNALEKCHSGDTVDGQCAEEPADTLGEASAAEDKPLEREETEAEQVSEVNDHVPDVDGELAHPRTDHDEAPVEPVVADAPPKPSLMSLLSARVTNSEAFQAVRPYYNDASDYFREWLPVLEEYRAYVAAEIKTYWLAFLQVWNMVVHEVSTVYASVYQVVVPFIKSVREQWQELWDAHEELRIVVRHLIGLSLLLLYGALFFALYSLAGAIPDFFAEAYRGLDDLTRAQVKMVLVLVVLVAFFQLKTLWSFWLVIGAVGGYYYWSGHVVVEPKPNQRAAPLLSSRKHLGERV
ncbi:hypothetical protein Poli38472_008909 [Pythium oligandrum]|uniref:Transmembrane protein n=1 Tax=Pythium oligandrum TaxID=41045 RepID=A0A8K1C4G2_PYTOL|nr:hypothetical protein Poli38472_008909 [Pythium oligandrum]|eukprot:TMW56261.1 hypothetical protein Poli38472_008909 [Pythium oligandrum]